MKAERFNRFLFLDLIGVFLQHIQLNSFEEDSLDLADVISSS